MAFRVGSASSFAALFLLARLSAADCNQNGLDDAEETRPVKVALSFRLPAVLPGPIEALSAVDIDGDGSIDVVAAHRELRQVSWLKNRGDASFDNPRSIDVDGEPTAVVLEDFDGDGRRDLAVTFASREDVSVHLGQGDGFSPGRHFDVGDASFVLTAADFDGDGDTDLITGGESSLLRFLRNLGDGSFAPFDNILTHSQAVRDLDPADFDGDGDVDLAIAGLDAERGLDVLWNWGAGILLSGAKLELGPQRQAIVADLDRDGDPDLVSNPDLDGQGSLQFHFNAGNRSFEKVTRNLEISLGTPFAAIDLDRDGRPEFAVPEPEGIRIARMDGSSDLIHVPESQPLGPQIVAADFDGDGALDLALVDPQYDGVVIALGALYSPVDCDGNGQPDSCEAPFPDCDGDAVPDLCAIRAISSEIPDCNLNGIPDACDVRDGLSPDCDGNGVPDECDSARRRDCDRNGVPDSCELESGDALDCNENGLPDRCDIASGRSLDFDADGIPDECDRDCDGDGLLDSLAVDSGAAPDCNGNGIPDACDLAPSPGPFVWIPIDDPQDGRDLTTLDLGGDGDLDLAVAASFRVVLIENDGGRRFETAAEIRVGNDPERLAAADLDGDGREDLVTMNAESLGNLPRNVTVLLNEGEAVFRTRANYFVGFGPGHLVCVDLDRDGASDLAVANERSLEVSVLFGLGDGTFGDRRTVRVGRVNLDAPVHMTAGELDGERGLELIVTQSLARRISTYGLSGGRDFEARSSYDTRQVPWGAHASDLDGDGDLDLVLSSGELLENSGGGVFRRYWDASPLASPLATIDSPPLDVNDDGAPDLILTTGTDRHEVLLNHGRGSFLEVGLALDNLSSRAITVAADIDGDSLVDLVALGPIRIDVHFSQLGPVERDCNFNGIPDRCDITAGRSSDVNGDDVPDECEGVRAFVRGDCNADGEVDMADAVCILGHLFLGGPHPTCLKTADVDDSARIDTSDVVRLLFALFRGGAPPEPPYPDCGRDLDSPTPDCRTFAACD